jgi:acetyltransferase-like isoleucine patch superfamily enzyme
MKAEDVRKAINAEEISIGRGVVIEPGATVSDVGGPAERVVLGDYAYIGGSSKIRIPSLTVGDYTQIHNHSLVYGSKGVAIGHNGWFGQNVILNSTDDLTIGDNCGVGAYSQLWTHILSGDVMEGCRWDATKPLVIGKDVWFVGHCIVSPITAEDRSMAMVGSVVTRDMKENRVYAGSPAKDVTDKVGPQFREVTPDEKVAYLTNKMNEFFAGNPSFSKKQIGIAVGDRIVQPGETLFDVNARTYNKRLDEVEVAFMKFLLPRAKFTPRDQ